MSTKKIKISSLKASPDNPRKWDVKALSKLAKSIEEFPEMMNIRPIITHKGIVIGGNMRLAAIRYLGMTEIPASWVKAAESLTKEQIKEFVVKDNVGFGAWDYKELINFAKPTDLTNWGMNAKTINSWRDRIRKVEDDENQPTAPSGLKIKTGDLIDFEGGHSIICADAKDRQAYTEILGETKADLLITDPPYGVDYTGKTKDRLKIDNDDLNEIELKNLLEKSLANSHLHLKQGGVAYIWHQSLKTVLFASAFLDVGFHHAQTLILVKNRPVLGRQDYNWQHEPCLYGWKKGASHYFTVFKNETTIVKDELMEMSKDELMEMVLEMQSGDAIRDQSPPSSRLHPTMKPVSLFAKLIQNSTKEGELVLDPFIGSGTTLIACEETKRVCAGIEIDPKYCEAIIRRWQSKYPEKSVKINGQQIELLQR